MIGRPAGRSNESGGGDDHGRTAVVVMRLELVVVPVSDVDRAKGFYEALGWPLDADFPACSLSSLGDPLGYAGAPRSSGERVSKILGLMENVPIAQFHDAYGVGRPPVIGDDALTDPEVAVPQDSAHRKVPIGRVASTLFLDGIPPAEPFPGLRIV